MLCFSAKGYNRACAAVIGGVSDIAIFDPDDFDFAQGASVAGVQPTYSAIALRSGSGAAGTAVLAGAGVGSVTITNPGTLYGAAPTLSFTGGGGSGAAGTAQVNASGAVTGVTITTPGTGYTTPPTVTFVGGGASAAAGAKMYFVNFLQDEGSWDWTHSTKGCAVKYEHVFSFTLPENSQALTTFMQGLDAAGCCCGIGIMVRLNSGKIFVAGERHVNGVSITRFRMKQDGSKGGSGKLFDDPNHGDIVLKGAYFRSLFEYNGTWADIEALY